MVNKISLSPEQVGPNHVNTGHTMSIPDHLRGRFAYHFTLLDNLPSIIEHGLLSTNRKNTQHIVHANVAEQGIQDRRQTMSVPCVPGRSVHDYVPFYFSKRTPMLLSIINKKNVDQHLIIYLAVPVTLIEQRAGVVFSDAAANTDIPPNFYDASNSQQLTTLNWEAIDSKIWGWPDEQLRHQKMAELLVPDSIGINEISHLIVWNEEIKAEVEKIFNAKGLVCPSIQFEPLHYYTRYRSDNYSIVTGPVWLKHFTEQTIQAINSYSGGPVKYADIKTALAAIGQNFCSIKSLADIDGLQADYGPHHGDVGEHCRHVAAGVETQAEYPQLTQTDKDIVKLAAYLHDIGKGPKSRWPSARMTGADNDHARKSLPMLQRILIEDIAKPDADSVRKLVTLVTYDDLVGDIVANGRNEQQLFDIITTEADVNMLIALGKADMAAINPMWVSNHYQAIEQLRQRAIAYLLGNSENSENSGNSGLC